VDFHVGVSGPWSPFVAQQAGKVNGKTPLTRAARVSSARRVKNIRAGEVDIRAGEMDFHIHVVRRCACIRVQDCLILVSSTNQLILLAATVFASATCPCVSSSRMQSPLASK